MSRFADIFLSYKAAEFLVATILLYRRTQLFEKFSERGLDDAALAAVTVLGGMVVTSKIGNAFHGSISGYLVIVSVVLLSGTYILFSKLRNSFPKNSMGFRGTIADRKDDPGK